MKIAYISCKDHEQYSVGYDDEEALLLRFLLQKGLDIERKVWNDPAVDWKQYGLALLKSPWDYHEHIEAFNKWLDSLQELHVRLLNPAEMVRWNSDKHYLNDIANAGLKIIPSLFMERGATPALLPLFEQLQTEKIIIKPCISAGARNVLTLTPGTISERQSTIYEWLLHESYVVQPFMEEIFAGEWSYVFFNGKYSHCVLKMPGGGDFRVQHYHGGSMMATEAGMAHIESAAAYVARFGKGSLYARIDGIMRNGAFHLMELELIEPYLYLDTHADGYENFYRELIAMINQPSRNSQ